MRGEILAAHRRANQQATQANDTVQLAAPLVDGPANPAVTRRQVDSRRSNADRAEPAVTGPDQIAYLTADQGPDAAGMLPHHQLRP